MLEPAVSAMSARPLPPGKLYHVFFSHSSEDTEWVADIVERLESEEYRYKCCFADRDFCVGIPVLQNITTCIHTSKRTVIVLSPEFLNSSWCTYETRITMELDIDTRRRLLIPVMLRDCTVPNFIGRLSYINAQSEHFWDRLLEAIDGSDLERNLRDEPSDSSVILSTSTSLFGYNPNFNTGQHLVDHIVNEPCRGNASEGEFIPDELISRGLEVTQEEYDLILKILRRDYYLSCHGIYIFIVWIIALCAIPTIAFFCLFLITQEKNNDKLLGASLTVALFVMLAGPIYYLGVWIRNSSARRSTMREINRVLEPRNILAGICDNGHCAWTCRKQIKVKFFYYGWTPCKIHLQKILALKEQGPEDVELLDVAIHEQQREYDTDNSTSFNSDQELSLSTDHDDTIPLSNSYNEEDDSLLNNNQASSVDSCIGNTNDIIASELNFLTNSEVRADQVLEIEEEDDQQLLANHQQENETDNSKEALELLLYFSMEYGYLLASRKLQKPETQRHTRQRECLCQFAESLLKDTTGKSSRMKSTFGGLSRSPCARYLGY